jgi:hypothetical protein
MTPGDRSLGQFAAEVVGLKPADNEGETIAALFRKLQDEDFLPDPLTHQALLALAGRPIESGSLLSEEAAASEQRRLHDEVERFASEFFEIPVAARVERWRALAQASARHPRLIDRLRILKLGLGIDRNAIDDPSPAVKQLLDDLLTLFPMRTEPRASESRARLERFLSDPSLNPATRTRALKHVLKRHPEVSALSRGYLAQLDKPRRAIKAERTEARAFSLPREKRDLHPTFYIFLALTVMGGLSRLTNSTRTTPPPFQVPVNSTVSPNFRPAVNPISVPKPKPGVTHFFLREEIKAKIKGELTRIGKEIDDKRLAEIVSVLPIDDLPQVGGMATLVLQGHWTKEVQTRFVGLLKESLDATDLDLSEQELDEVATKCFPSPTTQPAPSRPQSP